MTIRVACVQTDVAFNDPQTNASVAIAHLKALKEQGVDLAVLPEAFLTGYCVGSAEQALEIALPLESDRLARIRQAPEAVTRIGAACEDLGIHAVVGLIATDGVDVYNTALLFEPEGTIRRYFKTHLPFLGVDRFVVPGWNLPVFETEVGNLGICICYDLRVPEAVRVMALDGADVIVLPTNWPVGAETSADHTALVRAAENRVYVAACNRVGTENGTTFIGRSGIYDVVGGVMQKAGDGEETIIADLDLDEARNKHTVIIPGEYEFEVMGSRRPGLYDRISKQ
ncbi:MAG: carbon-nitrogen hydrolase family protein [Armatimonadetes bacterium]|nr:carbon-nitrogen hydrolase family protein [Armatimonadota bacterium]